LGMYGGNIGIYRQFRTGGGGGDEPPPRRLRKKTIFLLVMFRPSELPSNLSIVFVEPSRDKLFRPPFKPKRDHIVKDLHIY
jgi:hypothetical protein